MTAVLPAPVPLPDPPGDPAALDDVVDRLAGAGFALGVASAHLQGPASTAPGWLGADAAASAVQVGTTATVVGTVHDAVTAAVGLVGAHAEVMRSARARLRALREEQEDAFAAAERALALLVDPAAQVSSAADPPGARALVEGVALADADRAAEHRALLSSVEDDATAVGTALAAVTSGFGGGSTAAAGRPGEAVTLHLAAVLPGHGDGVLLDLGWQIAAELRAPGTAADVTAVAQQRRELLADPVVAGAAVVALGPAGVRQLLLQAAGDDELAGVLAVALGTAATAGDRVPGAGAVLTGLLDPGDPDGAVDRVAVGMAAVLAGSGSDFSPGGPVVATVPLAVLAAAWLPGLLARESAQGVRVVDRVPSAADPVAVALAVLAGTGAPGAAVAALGDPVDWEQLLLRVWTDGGAGLAELVELAAEDPGGGEVLTAALTSVGVHLLPAGDQVLTARPDTWELVAPALTTVAVAHAEVLVGSLSAPSAPGAAAVLAGQALLTVDRGRRTELAEAVARVTGPQAGWPTPDTAEVSGALVGVEDQSRRLAWLIEVAREVERAAVSRGWFDLTTLPVQFLTTASAPFWQAAVRSGAALMDADGRLDLPATHEQVLGDAGAVDRAGAAVGGVLPGVPPAALAGYDAVTAVLELPDPVLPNDSPSVIDPPILDRSSYWLSRWGLSSFLWWAGFGRPR